MSGNEKKNVDLTSEIFVVSKDKGLEQFKIKFDENSDTTLSLIHTELNNSLYGSVRSTSSKNIEVFQDAFGSYFAILDRDNLNITVLSQTGINEIGKIVGGAITNLDFSPCGHYLVTITNESSNGDNNLLVWKLNEGLIKPYIALQEKNYKGSETWPLLSWSSDDKYFIHRVKNAFHVHNVEKAERESKVELENVSLVKIAPNPLISSQTGEFLVAAFVPELKGKPARASVGVVQAGKFVELAGKSLFRAEECKIEWSSSSKHCLVRTETAEDATGKSYYGETTLFLLSLTDSLSVDLKTGGVKDFCWSPNGNEFVVISGEMPSLVSLYNLKGEQVFKFGEIHRNFCRFNRFGRFLLIAGFGSLPGDMDFYDLTKSLKIPTRIGGSQANCAVEYAWSPCGRFVFTASTFPRRRVDNRLQIFTYFGKKVYDAPFEELHFVQWRNTPSQAFPDLPKSKNITEKQLVETRTKYIPPHLRGKVVATAVTVLGDDTKGSQSLKQRETGPTKSQLLAAKRKEEQEKERVRVEQERALKAKPPQTNDMSEAEKLVRKLTKQMKAINVLEEKRASGGELNSEQLEKLSKKSELQAELDVAIKASNAR